MSGDRDPLYPVELAVELFRGIRDSALWVVPGGGHGPIFLSERDAFVRVATPFLAAREQCDGYARAASEHVRVCACRDELRGVALQANGAASTLDVHVHVFRSRNLLVRAEHDDDTLGRIRSDVDTDDVARRIEQEPRG